MPFFYFLSNINVFYIILKLRTPQTQNFLNFWNTWSGSRDIRIFWILNQKLSTYYWLFNAKLQNISCSVWFFFRHFFTVCYTGYSLINPSHVCAYMIQTLVHTWRGWGCSIFIETNVKRQSNPLPLKVCSIQQCTAHIQPSTIILKYDSKKCAFYEQQPW